jgi:hypothetical protein
MKLIGTRIALIGAGFRELGLDRFSALPAALECLSYLSGGKDALFYGDGHRHRCGITAFRRRSTRLNLARIEFNPRDEEAGVFAQLNLRNLSSIEPLIEATKR